MDGAVGNQNIYHKKEIVARVIINPAGTRILPLNYLYYALIKKMY